MHKLLFAIAFIPVILNTGRAQQAPDSNFEPVAVVELFTSEGCSSCPPADLLLTQLTAAAEKDHRKIFTLSFHVDYWDRLGWTDPFSSRAYSDRQRRYAETMKLSGVYTPQVVVNGNSELVGSDEPRLNEALLNALKTKTTASFTKLNITSNQDKKLTVSYQAVGNIKGTLVHFALVSGHESTAVKRGENGGRQLRHTHVVRRFTTQTSAYSGEATFDMAPSSSTGDLMVIAYIQRTTDLHIIAAAMVHL